MFATNHQRYQETRRILCPTATLLPLFNKFADSSLGYIDIYGNFEWRPKWGTIPQPIPYKGIALANCAIWPFIIFGSQRQNQLNIFITNFNLINHDADL